MVFKLVSRAVRGIFRGVRKVFSWLVNIPKPEDPRGLERQRTGSDHNLPVVYGERTIGAVEVHAFSTNQIQGLTGITVENRENAYLHYIMAFCHGEIEGFQEFFFNGVSQHDTQWENSYYIATRNGSDTQSAIPEAVLNIPNWSNAMRGRNVAYAYIVLYQNKNQDIWRGEPEITARVKGMKVFDPRTNTTKYSENNALAALNLLTNNIYGRGLSLNDVDVPAFVAAANFCDEGTSSEVTRTTCTSASNPNAPPVCHTSTITVSTPRYKIAAVLDTSQTVFDMYRELLQSFRAAPRRPNGKPSVWIETSGAPVMTFDEGDLVGAINYAVAGIKDRFNRFKVRYPNRDNNFERDEFIYPQDNDSIYQQWLAEDNGKELIGELELNTIADTSCAAQSAEIAAKSSRIGGQLSVVLPPYARLLEPGDVVAFNSNLYGWTAKPFRLRKIQEQNDGTFKAELSEHENAVYPWSGASWDEQIGGSWLGNATEPAAPTNLQLFADTTLATAGLLTWSSVTDAFVREYDVRILSGSNAVYDERVRGSSFIVPLLDVGSYVIEVRSVTTLGRTSEPASVALDLIVPSAPSALGLSSSNNTVTSEPKLTGAGLGTSFEFDIALATDINHSPTPRMRGASATFTAIPDTNYRVFVRSVNALGASNWVIGEIKTTNDVGQLPPAFIGELEGELEELEGRFPVKTVDISNGAVTANKISVDRLSALTANMGVLNAGTINVGGGDDYVIINDTQSYIDVGGRDGRVFRIGKDGDSYINGHALGAASIMGESLSQDAIDFIIASIGAAAPDSGGVRSMSVIPSSTTRALDTFNSNGSAVQLRVAYGGQSSGRILCGQGRPPPPPATPQITVTIRRGSTVLHTETLSGSVHITEQVSGNCIDFEINMPAIDISITDNTPPQGSISYNIVMAVSWPSEFGSLHTRLDFRSSQNAVAGGGGASTWAQLSGKPFETIGTGLEVAADALRVKYGTTAGTGAQGNDSRITGAAQKSANLSDLANANTARQNLGLGTAATRNVGESIGDAMEVGAFGTGLNGAPVGTLAESEVLKPTGQFNRYINEDSAYPEAVVTLSMRYDEGRGAEIATNHTNSRWYVRHFNGATGSFNPALELLHTGNILTTTGQSTQYPMTQKAVTDALNTKANTSTQVIAGTGLNGGGNLAANITLSVRYGTIAGTAAQGNDARLSNSREWTAPTVTELEAKDDTSKARRAWTAQRVWQAVRAWWDTVATPFGSDLISSATAAIARGKLGLGTAAVLNASEAATASTVALRKSNSRLEVASAISNNDAVNLAQLNAKANLTGALSVVMGTSGTGSAWAKVGTVSENQSISLLVFGGGDIGSNTRDNALIAAGVREGVLSAQYIALTASAHNRYLKVLTRQSGGSFEIWLQKATYQRNVSVYTTNLTSESQREVSLVWVTAQPSGLVEVAREVVLHNGTGNQTKAGTLTAQDFILS